MFSSRIVSRCQGGSQEKARQLLVAQRAELIADNTLVPGGHRLRFSKDNEFTSPSAAAAVIHGGAANGLTAWKSQGGKTL